MVPPFAIANNALSGDGHLHEVINGYPSRWDTSPPAADVEGARTQRLLTGVTRPLEVRARSLAQETPTALRGTRNAGRCVALSCHRLVA